MPPFVIEKPRPDDPSSFPGRNWNAETEAILTAGCVTRSRSPRRRSGSATRRAPETTPTTRRSRRSPTTAISRAGTSITPGLSTPRTTGATSSRRTTTSTRTARSRPSPATTGPRGPGDLPEQLRAAAAPDAEDGHADPRVRGGAGRRQVPRPLRLQQPERDDRRGDRRPEPLLARPREPRAADGLRVGRNAGRPPGRVRRERPHMVPDRKAGDSLKRLAALPGLDHRRQAARANRRSGKFNLEIDGEVAGGAEPRLGTAGRQGRSRSQPAGTQ